VGGGGSGSGRGGSRRGHWVGRRGSEGAAAHSVRKTLPT